MIGLVAEVVDHRQLLRLVLLGDLLQHLRTGDLVRQRVDDDVVFFALPGGTRLEAAVAFLVELDQVCARRNDLGAGRQIRTLDVLQQRTRGRFRIVEQVDAGGRHFTQVVRRNVRGHADGNARRAVQQHVRQPRRQHRRLVQRAVEVRHPVHRALAELAQQHFGVLRQLGFGVAHRRERLRFVLRTEIALPRDDRIAVREILRHQHHRFIRGAVAVRMELTDHVTDRARGFLRLGRGREPELAHRVDDASLHRLQAIAQRGQRAIEDHVHRIVEVGLFGEAAQRAAFDAFEIEFLVFHVRVLAS